MGTIVLVGFFLGASIFLFTLIALKKTGKFYLAPIVTFLIAVLTVLYGLFKVGGFEGMGYGIIGVGILTAAIGGTLLLPFMKGIKQSEFNKVDKSILFIVPALIFAIIVWTIALDEGYWIIEEGVIEAGNDTPSFYEVSTISEGSKQIHIQLGEKYEGKYLEVKDVKTMGNTEITVKVVDKGNAKEGLPFIEIGLDKIVEPLVVQTTDGEIINSKSTN
ncbi:YesK-like family protein [Lysinibacillus xylanilyticus]|uniref:YesK family protein n=1 Tax=Lysinibacillus xylanilyticus TaxID=582475 RepID=UPI002B242D20|nr:YesK family protein [Lysinibacillus xylanilyticus]MEB2302603.1 YesK-like family protein [Lysinibacillus xylanilyticus]